MRPNVKVSLERFQNLIDNLSASNADSIIGTDQNFDLLNLNTNNNVKCLLESFITGGYSPTINTPTRITHNTSTLIDNLYIKYTTGKLDLAQSIVISQIISQYSCR